MKRKDLQEICSDGVRAYTNYTKEDIQRELDRILKQEKEEAENNESS